MFSALGSIDWWHIMPDIPDDRLRTRWTPVVSGVGRIFVWGAHPPFSLLHSSPYPFPFSLPLPSTLPFHSFPLSFPPLPSIPARGSGEPQQKSNFVHFRVKIWHLVATIFNNFPENEVTKFSTVLHPTGCFRYILGFRRNNARQFARVSKRRYFLVRDRLVIDQM